MGQVKAVFDGAVVADPEPFDTGKSYGVNIPVYVNRQRKNRETDQFEDTGDTSKIRVTLWGDLADATDVRKGDIVEVHATIYERVYEGKNGPGRSLETDWVESIVVKYRKDENAKPKAKVGAGAPASEVAWGGDAEPVW